MVKKDLKRVLLIATLAIAVVLSGCSSSLKSTSSGTGSASEKKKVGGVIRTTIGAEPDNLDPWLSAASDTQAIMGNVFEGLVWYDEKVN